MPYVVYNTTTTALVIDRACGRIDYLTEAAAKAARTRLLRKLSMGKPMYKAEELAIAEGDFYYANIAKQVEKTNLMTGEKYMESVNTPRCLSPASEAYWSM